MANLLEWSENLPAWQSDALRRIAASHELTADDRTAIIRRAKRAHGIAIEGDVACVALAAEHLPAEDVAGDPTVLVGIGPVRHVDKLAPDQELRCATNGLTLNFGDNGSGKSGYARIAKKLCYARMVDDLHGDVFANPPEPPAEIHFRYRLPDAQQPQEVDWRDGDPCPAALSRLMVLDAVNAKVYVDGQNEITYLPREIEIVARYGALLTALAGGAQSEFAEVDARCRVAFGVGYNNATSASQLVSLLVTPTALEALPDDATICAAATWNDAFGVELAALERDLAQDPTAQAAVRRRALAVLDILAERLGGIGLVISDAAAAELRAKLVEARETAATAAQSAGERFADEPLAPHTGRGSWERMYEFVRAFAAEAGIRLVEEPFQVGDPCPTCQRGLDQAAAQRMQRFDEFVRSAAAGKAAAAKAALDEATQELRNLKISLEADLERELAEFRGLGDEAVRLCESASVYVQAANQRCDVMLAGIGDGVIAVLPVLPASPEAEIRTASDGLAEEAGALEQQQGPNAREIARLAELRDSKRLSEELEIALARAADLRLRLHLASYRTGLDTRAASQFASSRRRELVTPALRERIVAEAQRLDLGHIPLRFDEAAARGRNYFEMVLATNQQAAKDRVLSESEQRALGIACFMAEVARMPGRPGIIVDDPVTSLDLNRIRKVAERLVDEAASGRQVIIFTHNLVFYQEVLSAAADRNPQVNVLPNFISKLDGRFGLISENDEPWIAKKVTKRIEALRARLGNFGEGEDRGTDDYRRKVKDFYTDLRETWERMVEEVLLAGVVERFNSGIKTQNLKMVLVEDEDYRTIFVAMKHVSELSGHDMAGGRRIPLPDCTEIRRDLDALDTYRATVQRRRREFQDRREAQEGPPAAAVE